MLNLVPQGIHRFTRSEELSSPTASTYQVCKEVLQRENILPDSFCLLIPTSPLRTGKDLSNARRQFKGGCLMSVSLLEHLPQHALKIHNGRVIPREKISVDVKRQETAKMYRHDGYLIMCNTQSFFNVNDFYEMSITPWYTPPERNLDINTMDDLRLARLKMGEK